MRGPWTVVLLILSIGVTVTLVAIGISTGATRDAVVAAAAAIVSGFLILNFWSLVVDLDGERLELRFGLFSKRVDRTGIRRVQRVAQPARRYTGWGIRRLPDNTTAWLVPGAAAALRMELAAGGTLVVSVRDAHPFLDALSPPD